MRRLVLAEAEEDIRRFDRLRLPLAEQAGRLGVSIRSIERARAVLGLGKGKSPEVEITPEIDALLQRAAEEGWSREEAYRTTGVSHKRLKRLYPGIFMEPEDRGLAGALGRAEARARRGAPATPDTRGGREPFRWPSQ